MNFIQIVVLANFALAVSLSTERSLGMVLAAFLPAPVASMTVAAPVTASSVLEQLPTFHNVQPNL